ncbi:FKBP-type peptidyl-prolyl cis-trans isomerase [Roseivirga sp.]|uniref:FKBP-type peptidyl-prolyl cis-trans isomerase n=1 Tax=Roseivirga sp. TaxID=1964215 RepID=UPI003B8DC77D
MKKLTYIFSALMLLLAVSCDSDNIFDEAEQLEIDVALIDDYLSENNMTAQVDEESGLRYIIQQEGTGDNPGFGSTVFVHYTGTLLDGTQFDTSEGLDPFAVVIGRGNVIQGWDIGLRKLKVGTVAKFLIPSRLGYGSNRQGLLIPPNSVLLFDIRITDIRQ